MASEEARDWRTGLSLQERQRYMYEGKYACDVTLKVGKYNPEKIAAHRFVLVCGSPVFETMLTEGRKGDIVVEDVEPEVFNAVLKFLYCEQIELKVDTALDVLHAARKYEVSQLVIKCSDYLMGTIDVHNVCLYLTKSVQYDENELSAGCMDFISHNAKQVLDSTEFTAISHQSLKRILESDVTNCVSPRGVYTACLRWADSRCAVEAKPLTDDNRRAVLGSCLYLIRFPDMSNKEFTEMTRGSKLLTNDERLQILDYMSHREHGYEYKGPMVFNVEKRKPREGYKRGTSLNVEKSKPREEYKGGTLFNVEKSKPREGYKGGTSLNVEKSGEEYRVNRFKDIMTFVGWSGAGTSAIDFQCSRSVWIAGVGLYAAGYGVAVTVVVKLMDDEGEVLADTGNVDIKPTFSYTNDTHDVRFPERVRIPAGEFYRIAAECKCGHHRYGDVGQETVEVGGVTFTFSQTPGNQTTVDEGRIPEIIFST